jgi:colicin import membrane protein
MHTQWDFPGFAASGAVSTTMSRLQKKCFIASAALHFLLFALLVFGPAFISSTSRRTDNLPLLDVIPARLIDEAMSGGGQPAAAKQAEPRPETKAPAEPVTVQPAPRIEPPAPAPIESKPKPVVEMKPIVEQKPAIEKVDAHAEPRPPKQTTKLTKTKPASPEKLPPRKNEKSDSAKETKTKHETTVDLKPAVRSTAESLARKAKAEAAAKALEAAEEWKGQINKSLQALRSDLSPSTTIEAVGTGGEAYANYSQAIKSIYTEAWITPDDVIDDAATVHVEVTIARDGRVLSSSILKRSGIVSLDKSVQAALDRVERRRLPPFPEGASDTQRTFKINFNLKTKRSLG